MRDLESIEKDRQFLSVQCFVHLVKYCALESKVLAVKSPCAQQGGCAPDRTHHHRPVVRALSAVGDTRRDNVQVPGTCSS